jgi:hypothetical protein
MVYKKLMLLLCLIPCLYGMKSDNGQVSSLKEQIEQENAERLNKASQEGWDLLARFCNGEKVSHQEVFQTNQEYEQAYQEFLKRHQQSS